MVTKLSDIFLLPLIKQKDKSCNGKMNQELDDISKNRPYKNYGYKILQDDENVFSIQFFNGIGIFIILCIALICFSWLYLGSLINGFFEDNFILHVCTLMIGFPFFIYWFLICSVVFTKLTMEKRLELIIIEKNYLLFKFRKKIPSKCIEDIKIEEISWSDGFNSAHYISLFV